MRQRIFVALAAIGLVASACSAAATTAPATAAPTVAATAAPTAAPSASPSPAALGKILKSGKVTATDLALTPAQEAIVTGQSSGKLIGIVALTMDTQYHQNLNNAAMAEAQRLGYKLSLIHI